MKKKRSGLFIVVGVCCALLAVLVVKQKMGPKEAPGPAVKGTDVLVASRDIQYGEALVLENKGDNANVRIVRWPSDAKPDGALTKADETTEKVLRAADSFVKNELILSAKTIPDDEFVPEDMKIERISVDKDDVKSGKVRPGMRADILQIVNNEPRNFMRNVLVYAVGALDARSRPVYQKDPGSVAFLLIKSEDYLTFLRAKLNTKLLLIEATDPTIGGPLLVAASAREEAKRSEIKALIDDANALMATGDYEKALPILRRATELYPDVADLTSEAKNHAASCCDWLATRRYEQAERAVDQEGDYAGALLILDTIDKEFSEVTSVVKKAAALRRRAEEAREKNLSQVRFAATTRDLDAALAGGNVPRAAELVTDLKQLRDEGFKPRDEAQDLAKLITDYEKKVRDAGQTYESDKMVLESFLRQGNLAAAQTKLAQIKGKFPQHPGLAELEALVPADNGGL